MTNPLARVVSIADFGHSNIFVCIMQWDEKELDTQFTPNVYFWTPNSEILAKALNMLSLIDKNKLISVHHSHDC